MRLSKQLNPERIVKTMRTMMEYAWPAYLCDRDVRLSCQCDANRDGYEIQFDVGPRASSRGYGVFLEAVDLIAGPLHATIALARIIERAHQHFSRDTSKPQE